MSYNRERYLKHRESVLKDRRNKKDQINERRRSNKKAYEWQREYHRERRRTDPAYRLKCNLRNRAYDALRRGRAGSHISSLGCTVSELKAYIESKFLPGMTWENWGIRGWHIDHIQPLASFDLKDPEQFKAACHFTNLQPLWARDNIAKSDKDPNLDHV